MVPCAVYRKSWWEAAYVNSYSNIAYRNRTKVEITVVAFACFGAYSHPVVFLVLIQPYVYTRNRISRISVRNRSPKPWVWGNVEMLRMYAAGCCSNMTKPAVKGVIVGVSVYKVARRDKAVAHAYYNIAYRNHTHIKVEGTIWSRYSIGYWVSVPLFIQVNSHPRDITTCYAAGYCTCYTWEDRL